MSSIRLEVDGAVATIVLARPEARNALTAEMGEQIERLVAEISAMEEVRVLLVRGEGKAFSAGGDIGFIDARIAAGPEENRRVMRRFYDSFLALRTLRVPSIAVVHGAAMGAGVCLAMACDVRLAAQGTKLGLNFVRLGLHPGMGATLLLPRLVGPARAAELLLTGKTIEAEDALRFGLVSSVHPEADLLSAASAMAREIAEAAPLAVASTLRALRAWGARDLEMALGDEAREQSLSYATSDVVEGVRAAREKRAARFLGK